jgi:predicted lactoylglutathione lyase
MATQIFVNLPVKDLARSVAFFTPQDHGFMYAHGFEDPDGHIWELVYMGPAQAGKA